VAGIRVLPDSVINLISAGEVVERPASVVKELVENSLDSGASRITVELEQGGRKSIVVRDDGCGMSRHDLLLAVQRHATSKISSGDDLNSLASLGFRGEALPSIAAVTHFKIITSDGDESWELRMDGGVLSGVHQAPRTRGTTVTAGGLFFNQPARRKFLRTQATELSWAEQFVTGCAISRTDVEFSLMHNGSLLFRLPPAQTVAERLMTRYGLPSDCRFLAEEGESGGTVASMVLFPGHRWNRKTHQYILVNGRQVYSGLVSGTLDAALAGPAGYPLLCCSITVPPGEVDVNVHPAKREVRFREPSRVREAMGSALAGLSDREKNEVSAGLAGGGVNYRRFQDGVQAELGRELFERAMEVQAPSEPESHDRRDGDFPIVQIGRSYLVTSTDKGIVLIDQHAAHERILYETVLQAIRSDSGSGSQVLLLPESVRLDAGEIEQLDSCREVLTMSGFDYHVEGDTLVLTAVPQGTFHGIEALREILRSLQSPEFREMPAQERVAAAAACAGAVKFGDVLSSVETRHLVDRLFSTSDPFHCPHGRPTLLEITFEELAGRFGR
jgi:DNA mismatch repair protein MutL